MLKLPLNIDINKRQVTIIGGGAVAERKTAPILAAGALVTIIAPWVSPGLVKMREAGRLVHLAREYAAGDLSGAFLTIAATNSRSVNAAVAKEARQNQLLADICDAPELSSVTMPAVLRRGDLVITVSTNGKSPALARKIRDTLADTIGEEYAATLTVLGKVREKLLTTPVNNAYNKTLLSELVAHDLPQLIKEERFTELDRLLHELFGFTFSTRHLLGEKKDL